MPIFEYKCQTCGEEFDELETIAKRDEPHECPACGSMKSERLISTFCASSGEGGGSAGGKVCPTAGSG